MKKSKILLLLTAVLFFANTLVCYCQKSKDANSVKSKGMTMNNERLGEMIKTEAEILKSSEGYWELKYKSFHVIIVTDQKHNRMRIISPIKEESKLGDKDIKEVLSANFDRALDAKYAIYKGYLWSVFTHPLGELQDAQFKDALLQVVTLANNYGSTYTSTDLIFGGGK